MANPATHIILSEVFLQQHSAIERNSFLLGTSLPDIRYLDTSIPKNKYHKADVDLQEVLQQTTDFEKGIFFHSFIDRRRDMFYIERGVYVWGGDELFITALKCLEDEVLYEKCTYRSEVSQVFKEEWKNLTLDENRATLQIRYEALAQYFTTPISEETRTIVMQTCAFPLPLIQQINQKVQEIKKDKELLALIAKFYMFYSAFLVL
ncbi:MAG: hypothetical protein LBG52_03990 [Candidatus Peribacteria bacterium]|jgi:hypothetical protein|nr:hypothetical protein [Candidatus Peribacteria bacterium]